MPDTPVRVGVPTALARDLVQRVVAGFVDQVTLDLKNLKAKKSGKVKKVVTLGEYDLKVDIHRVTGKLKTGKPEVTFGGNKVAVALPVTVASGSGTGHDLLQVGRQERRRRHLRRPRGDPGGLGRGPARDLPGVGQPRPGRHREGHPGRAALPDRSRSA